MVPEPRRSLTARLRGRLARMRQQRRLVGSIRHLHGPRHPPADLQAVTVIALVRDGTYYLDAFLRHYRRLGAARFVFCDNGSTDGTVARLAAEPDTVVLHSPEPWGAVENTFRSHAARRYAAGRWCLFADMDEIFDFEGAAQVGLSGLVRYLSARGYTALVAQMLDMFPRAPLARVAALDYETALAEFCHYDLRGVTRHAYHDPALTDLAWYLAQNTVADDRIGVLFGGVRARVFGERCCLTKHPLVHVTGRAAPGMHPHCAAGVACADFTALIRHYKFANDPAGRDADTRRRGAIGHDADRQRLAVYEADPGLCLWSKGARRYDGIGALADQGFLVRSAAYGAWLAEQAP